MTPVDAIYQKYISVFYELDAGGAWIDLAAVRYALRAALRELAAAQPAVDITQKHRDLAATVLEIESVLATHAGDAYADFVDRHIELPTVIARVIEGHKAALSAKLTPDRCQLERINEWLFEHAPDLADNPLNNTADASIAAMDRLRGQVVLLQKLADWLDTRYVNDSDGNEVDTAIKLLEFQAAEVDALRQQLAQMDADNARLTEELRTVRSWSVAPTGNGKSHPAIFPSAQSADETPAWNDAMLTGLDAATLDYWHGIAAGRWTWRKLPKSTRLAMVRHVLSFGPEERAMSMSEFDAIKPHWMPGAGSHPITFSVPWSTLSDMRVEIEVTP